MVGANTRLHVQVSVHTAVPDDLNRDFWIPISVALTDESVKNQTNSYCSLYVDVGIEDSKGAK